MQRMSVCSATSRSHQWIASNVNAFFRTHPLRVFSSMHPSVHSTYCTFEHTLTHSLAYSSSIHIARAACSVRAPRCDDEWTRTDGNKPKMTIKRVRDSREEAEGKRSKRTPVIIVWRNMRKTRTTNPFGQISFSFSLIDSRRQEDGNGTKTKVCRMTRAVDGAVDRDVNVFLIRISN